MNKTLRIEGASLKALPAGLTRPTDGDWVCMSAEIPPADEHDGDIVRVKGMSVPAEIPLQAQHMKHAPDGSPTTIGKVVQTLDSNIEWKGKSVPAKLARFKWADTELANKYKQLWPEFINSVSIGASVLEASPITKGGVGLDIKKTEVFELSLVTVGANPAAGALKAIKDALGDDFESPTIDITKELIPKTDEALNLLKSIHTKLDAFDQRLDLIESAAVARSNAAPVPANDDHKGPTQSDLSKAAEMLAALSKSLAKGK